MSFLCFSYRGVQQISWFALIFLQKIPEIILLFLLHLKILLKLLNLDPGNVLVLIIVLLLTTGSFEIITIVPNLENGDQGARNTTHNYKYCVVVVPGEGEFESMR